MKTPELVEARELIVKTAIAYRTAILKRDKAFESGPSDVAHRAAEKADREEVIHLRAIQHFFETCKKFNVEPH